ncbi:MAG: hypothetical protein M3Y87_25275, partial [Myxococcota bacterium]|nr:hypothetical protein [Myxococcota bacterium]
AGAGGGAGATDGGGRSVVEEPAFWIIAVGVVLLAGGVTAGILVDQASHVPVQTGVSFGLP